MDIKLKNNQSLYIFPLSDLHFGNRSCNKEFFDVWCELFRTCKGEKVIYLLGDLLETPNSKFSAYDADMSTNDAMDYVVKKLKPFQDYIRWSASGNHELRTSNQYHYDINKELSSRLNCKHTKNDFFDVLQINGQSFTVYGLHGVSTSRSSDLALRKFKSDTSKIANLYLQGHNHLLKFDSEYVRSAEGGFRRYYGFTGHFLVYEDSYANDKQYPINPAGFQRISVDSDLRVNSHYYWSDELMKHQDTI